MKAPTLENLLKDITEENRHPEMWPPQSAVLANKPAERQSSSVAMPRELTDEQADAAMRATAVHLDIKGSQLTVNREKMKARYRSLVKFIEGKTNVEPNV